GPALAARGERLGELGERRPRTDGCNEVARFVFDDSTQRGDVQRRVVTRGRIAHAQTGRAAADHDSFAAFVRPADSFDYLGLARCADDAGRGQAVDVVRVQPQRYTHMPSASALFVRSVGMSAQASPPGKTFPGFMVPSGSNASRPRR